MCYRLGNEDKLVVFGVVEGYDKLLKETGTGSDGRDSYGGHGGMA